MATGRPIRTSKRVAAKAMVDMGMSVRQVAKELEISKSAVSDIMYDPSLDPAQVERVKSRLQDRLVIASDRFLTRAVDGIQDLHPYQAMLCSGIAHDHYLRSTAASRGDAASGLTQILVLIDQRTISSGSPPANTDT